MAVGKERFAADAAVVMQYMQVREITLDARAQQTTHAVCGVEAEIH